MMRHGMNVNNEWSDASSHCVFQMQGPVSIRFLSTSDARQIWGFHARCRTHRCFSKIPSINHFRASCAQANRRYLNFDWTLDIVVRAAILFASRYRANASHLFRCRVLVFCPRFVSATVRAHYWRPPDKTARFSTGFLIEIAPCSWYDYWPPPALCRCYVDGTNTNN